MSLPSGSGGGIRLSAGAIVSIVAGLAALVVAVVIIRPLGPATNDPDSAASVLYFQRIVAGTHLEAMVTTTPKPLLTVVYGLAWSLTHDWSVLTWLTILVFALGVALAARLAVDLRLAAAAGFVVVGLVGWPELLLEVAHANSLPWAAAGWIVAAWAIGGPRPRPWIAGAAILLAGLARVETFWLVGAAAVAIGVIAVTEVARTQRRPGIATRTAVARLGPIVIEGALAIVVMCVHDLALTGQPLYWLGVPASYTTIVAPGLHAIGLGDFWETLAVPHYRNDLPTIVLAVAGVIALGRARRPEIALGIVVLVAGVFATLGGLAVRGVYISDRYWEEADVAIRFSAAFGAGWLVRSTGRAARGILGREPVPGRFRTPVLVAIGAAFGIVLGSSVIARAEIEEPLATVRDGSANLAAIEPRLRAILAGARGSVVHQNGVELPVVDLAGTRLVAPREDILPIAVDTGAPLTAIGDSFLAFRADLPATGLVPGQWVFHDAAVDGRGGRYASLEVSRPTVVGSIRIVPILADPASGIWLLRIDRP